MTGTPGSREAARLIRAASNEPAAGSHAPETRPYLEAFYALAALLPDAHLPPRLTTERMRAVAHLADRSADAGQTLSPAPPASAGAEGPRDARPRGRVPRRTRTVAIPVIALVAIVLALAFVTTLLFVPRPEFSPQSALYLFGTGAASSARGVVLAGDEDLLVFASGLEELERGYRYVAWTVSDGTYERVGSMVALGSGRLRLRTRRSETAPQVEVTIEPATATGQPTGPTVLAGFRDPP